MAEFFSTNLKHLRESKGLSQNKLAEKIGVNQTTIARWEDDNRVPTIDNAIDVAKALNISLIDLLGKDLRFEEAELPPDNCIDEFIKENTISDEELEKRLKQFEENEGIQVLIDNVADMSEKGLNQVLNYAKFLKEQDEKNEQDKT